jgi:hypothetical protein
MKARIFNHGSQRSSSGKNIGIHTVKLMVQCLPAPFRKIGTTTVNLPIQFSRYCLPPDPLEPVYCETRSVHSPGKSDNWNKYCENVSSEEKRGCSSHDIHKGWRSLPK